MRGKSVLIEYAVLLAICTAIGRAEPAEAAGPLMQRIVPVPYEVELPVVEESACDEESPYIYPDIPAEVQEAARKYGEAYGITPELLMAMAFYESSYDPEAVGGECLGLLQVNPRWHQNRMARLGVTEEGLFTVDGCMAVGADYLAELLAGTDNIAYALMRYNGDSRAEAYRRCECGMSGYAERILKLAGELAEKSHETQ